MSKEAVRSPLAHLNLLADPSAVRLSKSDRLRFFYPLVTLLQKQSPKVAGVLAGSIEKAWTQKQIRAVERVILRDVIADQDVIGYLRVLRSLCQCWVLRQDCYAPLPRHAILLKDVWNPFSRNVAQAFSQYREWGKWLEGSHDLLLPSDHGCCVKASAQPVVPVLVSAILYGGLWCQASLVALIKTIPELLSHTLASRKTIHIGLSLTHRGAEFGEFRAWQPDPLTAMLLLSLPDNAVDQLLGPDPTSKSGNLSDDVIFRRLVSIFDQVAKDECNEDKPPTGLLALLRLAETVGYTQMPPVIVAYATRRIISDSLSMGQIKRTSQNAWLYEPQSADCESISGGEEEEPDRDAVNRRDPNLPDWYNLISKAMEKVDSVTARLQLNTLVHSNELSPLGKRIADFACRSIQIRTLYAAKRSVEVLRQRCLLLAREMTKIWGDADPMALPDDELQTGYEQIVKSARECGTSNGTRRNLHSALREFHVYACDCHGKQDLKDPSLLAPLQVVDRVDVDLVTFAEFTEIMRQIELRWPGLALSRHRIIAQTLVVLGFRCGLRREEARLLRIRDIASNGVVEVLIRSFLDHHLKSPSSRRRAPIASMATAKELLRLLELQKSRVSESAGPKDFLFGGSSGDHEVVSATIFVELNKIVALVTGTLESEHPTHFHHLRHGFASFWLARLLLPNGCDVPVFLEDACKAWSTPGEGFGPTQTLRDRRPSRNNLFLVGSLLGHVHPLTTMSRYFHFSAELLRIYIDRSEVMRPSPTLLTRWSAAVAKKASGAALLDGPMGAALFLLLSKAEDAKEKSPHPVFQPSTRMTARDNSLWINRYLDLLRLVETPDGSIEYAATTVGVDVNRAREVVGAAEYLSMLKSGNGSWRHRVRMVRPDLDRPEITIRSFVPSKVLHPNDLAVISSLAPLIELLHKDPRTTMLVERGVEAYVTSVWSSQSYPVFHHPSRDGDRARSFLDLLRKLKIRLKDIHLMSFDPHERSKWTAPWSTVLGISSRFVFEKWKNPFGLIESSESWLAIGPEFGFDTRALNGSGIFGFRFLMVMAYVSFGSHPR
jgi:integrase